jgi:hypothetical protein
VSEPPVIEIVPGAPPEPPRSPRDRPKPWWRRRWVTVGEFVGVAALAVAVLGYLDSHRERDEARVEKRQETQAAAARATLTLVGRPAADGARLALSPMRDGQAVQSQRYLFPKAVLDHAMEVSAAQPQVDRDWVAGGLVRAAKAAGGAQSGEGQVPVGIETRYIEDGDARTDRAVYAVGYRIARGGLFSGPKVTLQGLELVRRAGAGDLQALVEARWKADAARGLEGGG